MQALGDRYRRWLIESHLWSGDCSTLEQVTVIADSTPRNRDSGAALAKGLAPACDAHYLALDASQNNPLFHFGNKDIKDDDAPPSAASRAWPSEALAELQRVLLDCNDDTCVAQSKDATRRLFDPTKDDAAARAKTLKTAGSLSENLMLEYAQGFPAEDVAWGHGDAATIGRLISLHNLQFGLTKRSMPAASQAASNLVAHIMASWQQAVGRKPEVAPLAGRGMHAILLVGHDTNLANLGGLLDVDWHDERQPDDYPPGGALVFDLLRDHGKPVVRVSSLMPTLDALRHADFGGNDALVQHALALAPCHGATTCPLDVVRDWLSTRVDDGRVDAGMPMLSTWPAAPR